jgi:hypothetical protein
MEDKQKDRSVPHGIQSSANEPSNKKSNDSESHSDTAAAKHPRQPGEGPQTEKEARAAGEAPSPVNNEGAQNQGQVDTLDENEKTEGPYGSQEDASSDTPESSSDMPKEGTKPNKEMDTQEASDLNQSNK